jgi:DNA-directed RNA polymerase specialized sigma24 family protein
MDRDAAFSEYAAARWRVLVRGGVLLGCDVAESEDLAQQTLLRCYLKWGRVEGAVDRDAYVARIQLNLLRQGRRRRWTGMVRCPMPQVRLMTPMRCDALWQLFRRRSARPSSCGTTYISLRPRWLLRPG